MPGCAVKQYIFIIQIKLLIPSIVLTKLCLKFMMDKYLDIKTFDLIRARDFFFTLNSHILSNKFEFNKT